MPKKRKKVRKPVRRRPREGAVRQDTGTTRAIEAAGNEGDLSPGDVQYLLRDPRLEPPQERLPVIDEIDLKLGRHLLPRTLWTWGRDWPRPRRASVGWGASVEVPAVLELLDLVVAGSATAQEARSLLTEAASLLADHHDPRRVDVRREDAEGCQGDCRHCQAKIPELEELRTQGLEQKRRFADHASYPYAVGSTAIHRVTCSTVRGFGGLWEPVSAEETEEEMFKRLLFFYTHGNSHFGIVSSYGILSPEELSEWVKEHTGPRGGKNYRLCKMCTPEIAVGSSA